MNGPRVQLVPEDKTWSKRVAIQRLETGDFRADLAVHLLERWGMVAAVEDGEDSAGRSRFRLQTTDELVQRACDTAEKMHAELWRRNLMVEIPRIETEEKK